MKYLWTSICDTTLFKCLKVSTEQKSRYRKSVNIAYVSAFFIKIHRTFFSAALIYMHLLLSKGDWVCPSKYSKSKTFKMTIKLHLACIWVMHFKIFLSQASSYYRKWERNYLIYKCKEIINSKRIFSFNKFLLFVLCHS